MWMKGVSDDMSQNAPASMVTKLVRLSLCKPSTLTLRRHGKQCSANGCADFATLRPSLSQRTQHAADDGTFTGQYSLRRSTPQTWGTYL